MGSELVRPGAGNVSTTRLEAVIHRLEFRVVPGAQVRNPSRGQHVEGGARATDESETTSPDRGRAERQ